MDNLPEIRDIHIPDGVSIFPIAYGWWIILACLLGGIAFIYFIFWVYKTSRKIYALKELDKIDMSSPVNSAIEYSKLLRRICKITYKDASSLYGEEWLNFLTQHSSVSLSNSTQKLLLLAPFMQKDSTQYTKEQSAELARFCKNFIRTNL